MEGQVTINLKDFDDLKSDQKRLKEILYRLEQSVECNVVEADDSCTLEVNMSISSMEYLVKNTIVPNLKSEEYSEYEPKEIEVKYTGFEEKA